jgi:hypothetical protein
VGHDIGSQDCFDAARWHALKVRRERVAAEVSARLLFWLDAEAIALAPHGALALWAWRGGEYEFTPLSARAYVRTQQLAVADEMRARGLTVPSS